MIKKLIAIIFAAIVALSACGCGPPESSGGSDGEPSGVVTPEKPKPDPEPDPIAPEYGDDTTYAQKLDFTLRSYSATDELGRYFDSVGEWDTNKQVGIFYFLWMENAEKDISKLSEADIKTDNSTVNMFHYWSEPLYGYYDASDVWVFRKHLEMFAAAGIDYIFFDATNGYCYANVLNKLLPVALELYESGCKVPKFAFYCNTETKKTVTEIYDTFYDPNTQNGAKYKDLWYRWRDTDNANPDGKPWIAARTNYGDGKDFKDCSQEIRNFFYIKDAQWPNEPQGANFANGMPWMSWAGNESVQYNHNGIMSVSVAQHTSGAFSDAVLMNDRTKGRGRGWNSTTRTNDADKVRAGSNYQWQWDNAINNSGVNNVFITGWNEWIAQKQPVGKGRSTCYFVDCFNEEFSRDIEPMKGGYGDNFYLQTALNIRRFKQKGTAVAESIDPRNIEWLGDDDQWNGTACYVDIQGDADARNCRSTMSGVASYTDNSGRNDITSVRVAHDGDYVYMRITCAKNITKRTAGDKGWMNVFFEISDLGGANWNNYHYVVGRNEQNGKLTVERLDGNCNGELSGYADYDLFMDTLTVRIARNDLDLTENNKKFAFKVADNVADPADIMSYYATGDCAPIGRLSYIYRIK